VAKAFIGEELTTYFPLSGCFLYKSTNIISKLWKMHIICLPQAGFAPLAPGL
jgi:hypothetical protein